MIRASRSLRPTSHGPGGISTTVSCGRARFSVTAMRRTRRPHSCGGGGGINGGFNRERELREIDEGSAAEMLYWLVGNTLAHHSELMPPERAAAFTAAFMSLVPAQRAGFANGEVSWLAGGRAWAGNPATDFTFDEGVVAVAEVEPGWPGSPTRTDDRPAPSEDDPNVSAQAQGGAPPFRHCSRRRAAAVRRRANARR